MMRKPGDYSDLAVSPVVGVMLMLVVVVIIAAVVSGFSGGLLGNQEKAPTLSMDVSIKNSGHWSGSAFVARVTGIEKAISTKDLKIVTKWSHVSSDGTRTTGGNTILPGVNNTHTYRSPGGGCNNPGSQIYISPQGYGTGVGETGSSSGKSVGKSGSASMSFGNYDLTVGTSMFAQPFGETARPTGGGHYSTSYTVGYGVDGLWDYVAGIHPVSDTDPTTCAEFIYPSQNSLPEDTEKGDFSAGTYDPMTAVLGQGWEDLRAGDIVSVSVIHTPTGRTIWSQDVVVED